MKVVPVLIDEQDRLTAHNEHNIPEIPEVGFDDILHIAAAICCTPVSLVGIADANGQWFRPSDWPGTTIMPDDFPFYNPSPSEVLVIPDLSKDKRLQSHPYVTGKPFAVFYVGVPLVGPEGGISGTLCIVDTKPRELEITQIKALQALGKQVARQFEMSGKVAELKRKQAELKMAYADIAKIAHIASHDLKSPLNNIISLTHLLIEDYGAKFDAEGSEYIHFLNDAAYQLSGLVSGILSYSRSSQLLVEHKENINIGALIEEVNGLLNIPAGTVIIYPYDGRIHTSRVALKQIFLHLLHNAIKYNDKSKIKIEVIFNDEDAAYTFEVSDNGPGIAEADREKIFELFERLERKIKDGESMGIGMAIVKRLVEKLGGSIKVSPEITNGASFLFTIPKDFVA